MLFMFCFFLLGFTNAQPVAIQEGSWFLEANTRLGIASGNLGNLPSTGFGLRSVDGNTTWSVGGEGGYFVQDNVALKGGIGFYATENFQAFSYKAGVRYYILDVAPVQLDITGTTSEDFNDNPLWLGIQGGYAFFLTDAVALEPKLRYNFSLNEDFAEDDVLELQMGFVVFFSGSEANR